MYFGLVIYGLIGILFFFIGISAYKSKKPVSFWNVKPPVTESEIVNIPAYNRSYGILFIVYAVVWILFGFSFLLKLSWYIYLLEIFLSLIVLILTYTWIYRKYKRQ